VEDRLPQATDLSHTVAVGSLTAESSASAAVPTAAAAAATDDAWFLKTSEAKYIGRSIEAMYHVRHKHICLISPFLQYNILESTHRFGRFLDRAVEENTVVELITSGDHNKEYLPVFRRLEERGIFVYFLKGLHAKLYFFDVDLSSRNKWQLGIESHAIVGSSNLTGAGLGFGDSAPNEELNIRLGSAFLGDVDLYKTKLVLAADDFETYALKTSRRGR
jgi:hypothetical protein